jgi:hypothetical protein
MALSTIQRRQDAERARVAAYEATLRKPRASSNTLDVNAIARVVTSGFRDRLIRQPSTWPGRIKSKDPAKIALAIARHVFAAYPVPQHLERIWLGGEQLDQKEIVRRKTWYVEVAQGRSLYKTQTRDVLTRRETHVFVTAPSGLSFNEALWHAVARSYGDDLGVALRIARSKVARHDITPFWRDAARFFAVNPVPLNEIDDLCDFFEARLAENRRYSLKGRTLSLLRAQCEAWHRDLARIRRVGGGSWEGSPLPDWSCKVRHREQRHKDVTWTVTQIKTGRELAEEGNRMRHCVYSYKPLCMSGRSSIWSVKACNWAGSQRVLTIELDAYNRVVQIRGYANRLPKPSEMSIVRRWATANTIGGV